MKEELEEFLNNTDNFNNIKHRSEADLQFELGYFLKSKKKIDTVRFEYQFKDIYKRSNQILKKEADLCVLNNDNVSVDACIEIKLLKADSGSTNFFASCFEDICYLLQLKNEGEISRGYFVLVCACTKTIQSPNKSLGYRFWKGFAPNEIGDNNKLKELSDYKEEDLPNISSWKHQKLRGFIKTDKSLNSLVGKKVEYLFKKDINSEYAYCIVEI
jgi:hypothetical protein